MTTRRQVAIAAIEDLAVSQFHLFTTSQALERGVDKDTLGRSDRWDRFLPRTYLLRGAPEHDCRNPMAAQLSIGPHGVLSHVTAARVDRLDGLVRHPDVHLSGPVAAHRVAPWIRVHRREVPPELVTVTGPLVHTTPIRTLRDSCALLDELRIERMVESVLRRGIALAEIEALLDGPRFWGSARLARVMARRPPGIPPTASELETRYWQLIRWGRLPMPMRQFVVVVGGTVVVLDFAWPELLTFAETDGLATHDRPEALLYDRHRQNEVVLALGFRPLRFTWTDVVQHPTNTLRVTERALRLGGWRG